MVFHKSSVVFNEEDHSYFLGEKRLMGITGLIHSILGLGVYPEASDYVKGYTIPRAGSKGTAVHHAIQAFDEIGIKVTSQTVPTTYFKGQPNERVEEETWDVTNQLNAYIRHKLAYGFKAFANELTVSDNIRYASQIDNVWFNPSAAEIWLVDTKTNNLELYPLCGYFKSNYFKNGKDALQEYLSWQLSIYAVLFEDENPEFKVEGLGCNWLREDQAEFWLIERKPENLVRELLKTEWTMIDGHVSYYHPDLSVFGIDEQHETMPAPVVNTLPEVPTDVVKYVTDLIVAEKEIKSKLEEAKAGLRKAMETHGVKSFDFGTFKATIAADSERASFDSARFKNDHPDLYKEYTVKKTTKGGFTLKSKE